MKNRIMTVLAILIIGIAAYLSNSDTPYDPNALDFEMTPVDSFKREVDNFPNKSCPPGIITLYSIFLALEDTHQLKSILEHLSPACNDS